QSVLVAPVLAPRAGLHALGQTQLDQLPLHGPRALEADPGLDGEGGVAGVDVAAVRVRVGCPDERDRLEGGATDAATGAAGVARDEAGQAGAEDDLFPLEEADRAELAAHQAPPLRRGLRTLRASTSSPQATPAPPPYPDAEPRGGPSRLDMPARAPRRSAPGSAGRRPARRRSPTPSRSRTASASAWSCRRPRRSERPLDRRGGDPQHRGDLPRRPAQ